MDVRQTLLVPVMVSMIVLAVLLGMAPASRSTVAAPQAGGDAALILSLADGPDAVEVAAPRDDYSNLRVAGSTLRPTDSSVGWTAGDRGGCIYATSGTGEEKWNVPLYLPQGATVKQLRMYFYDASTSECVGWFTVYDRYGETINEWSVQSSGDEDYNYEISDVFTHTIDYENYSYVLNWRPVITGSDMQLCGFRVDYYPPPFGIAFLPSVFRGYQ